QGTWRVLKDDERLDLFGNLLSEAKGAAASQEALARIRTGYEQAADATESKAEQDRKTLATMIKALYVMGAWPTPGTKIEKYFQSLPAVAKELSSQKPEAAP